MKQLFPTLRKKRTPRRKRGGMIVFGKHSSTGPKSRFILKRKGISQIR